MASQTGEIQQLLVAEKKATEKVTEAKKRKAKRLKQAKDEAQIEIDRFKMERQKQYDEFELKFSGSKDEIAAKITADTEQRINLMNQSVAAKKQDIIKLLIESTVKINPRVHRNYEPKEQN